MNILFITLCDIRDIDNHGIYEDLLREFAKNGHKVCIVSPTERRNHECSQVINKKNCHILKVKTGNIQKTNIVEKGLTTVSLEFLLVKAIKRYFSNIKFDLILYSTPPITVAKAVEFIKKRDNARTYLLLKDIFPQNAIDLGMLKTTGLMSLMYHFFRRKERKLYELSDHIGCMSQANVDYILKHNDTLKPEKVEICPNCIEPRDLSILAENKLVMRKKYGIPLNKKVFVYGGNLGKPQGIPFLIECLKQVVNNRDIFFLIIGSGTEFAKLQEFITKFSPDNVKLLNRLEKEDYDQMIGSCDIGMIFLDHRFTIPNFPSRLLSYMQAKLPVLAVTDPHTDIGQVITDGGFGWWCESNNVQTFCKTLDVICKTPNLSPLGLAAWQYLQQNYNVETAYKKIIKFNQI